MRKGQHTSIVTIASSGPRFIKANMFPTANTVKLGDPISLTVGYRGGSSSRDSRPARQMYDAVCASCGVSCKVPFEPRNDRPVYCSDCFRR